MEGPNFGDRRNALQAIPFSCVIYTPLSMEFLYRNKILRNMKTLTRGSFHGSVLPEATSLHVNDVTYITRNI